MGTCGRQPRRASILFTARPDLSTGSVFKFNRGLTMADYRIGLTNFPDLPIATAVATSRLHFRQYFRRWNFKLASYKFEDEPDPNRDDETLPPDPLPREIAQTGAPDRRRRV